MKLYHGSNVPVNVPDLKHSKPYKDFGQGFYLSADRKQAIPQACITKVQGTSIPSFKTNSPPQR